MLFPTLGPSSLPVVVAQPDERHVNRTASVLEWYDRYRAYSGSNKVVLGMLSSLVSHLMVFLIGNHFHKI